jgi:hypothetical protein
MATPSGRKTRFNHHQLVDRVLGTAADIGGIMFEEHRFIQGMFAFKGTGLETPVSFEPKVTYQVPSDKRAQLIYCRIGNPTPEFLYVALNHDGKSMRMFPCGAKAGIHVPLAIIDDILPDSVLELVIAAPEGLTAKVMVDLGFVEI